MPRYLICALLILMCCRSGEAAQGDPVAVRKWSGDMVSLETHWGLQLAIKTPDAAVGELPGGVDQTISTSDRVDHVLFREPNASDSSWLPIADATTKDANQVRVRSVGNGVVTITVDGIVVVVVHPSTTDRDIDVPDGVDVLVVASGDGSTPTDKSIAKWAAQWRPRFVIPLGIDSANETVRTLVESEQFKAKVIRQTHNTFAVSHSGNKATQSQIVLLRDTAWTMPQPLAEEFAKMEQACRESQKVFAKLSVEQTNFRPENGTHTPRWNAEHMMGRQLLFFSQIYHAIDPAIPTLDLNPKQMPPDYEFAHPDWDGAEEARQMQRVSDFTRRFAYLLDGVELDTKAPGSRWPTLRALLKQMQRHYGEHTANTEKKFELPGFPK
ncbi:DinB family protein [Novipirellula caenicola]|uniref:DinB-like domain-containing protein n=1 Tax=Novipirellula caenicola TaxID=1536901 RepID=A0ABP9VWE4_9BACT